MVVTLPGIVTLVRLVQSLNAYAPMLVTLAGIVTLVRLAAAKTGSWPFPMMVTNRPLMLVGMVTAPPGPVYAMMVMVFVLPAFMLYVVLGLHRCRRGQ